VVWPHCHEWQSQRQLGRRGSRGSSAGSQWRLPDGTRQIVIATDKPVSFLAAASDSRVMDDPFSFDEMLMKPNDKGKRRLLVATAVDVKNGRLELENYGQEPVRLTTITPEVPKQK
jgi:hypothetical protein